LAILSVFGCHGDQSAAKVSVVLIGEVTDGDAGTYKIVVDVERSILAAEWIGREETGRCNRRNFLQERAVGTIGLGLYILGDDGRERLRVSVAAGTRGGWSSACSGRDVTLVGHAVSGVHLSDPGENKRSGPKEW
jgi:hypothetical protein